MDASDIKGGDYHTVANLPSGDGYGPYQSRGVGLTPEATTPIQSGPIDSVTHA